MNRHRRLQVGLSLARYLDVAPGEDLARAELQRDLGLEPLDVVLFVLSFEESADITFRVEELERVHTAGELVAVVAGWLDEYDHDERIADDDERLEQHVGAT